MDMKLETKRRTGDLETFDVFDYSLEYPDIWAGRGIIDRYSGRVYFTREESFMSVDKARGVLIPKELFNDEARMNWFIVDEFRNWERKLECADMDNFKKWALEEDWAVGIGMDDIIHVRFGPYHWYGTLDHRLETVTITGEAGHSLKMDPEDVACYIYQVETVNTAHVGFVIARASMDGFKDEVVKFCQRNVEHLSGR